LATFAHSPDHLPRKPLVPRMSPRVTTAQPEPHHNVQSASAELTDIATGSRRISVRRSANLAIRAAIACLTKMEPSHAPHHSVRSSRRKRGQSLQQPPSRAAVSQTPGSLINHSELTTVHTEVGRCPDAGTLGRCSIILRAALSTIIVHVP